MLIKYAVSSTIKMPFLALFVTFAQWSFWLATHCDKEKKPLKVGENFDSGCLFLSKPNGGVSRRAHTQQ